MGNPFVHVELNTTDVNKAKKFYSQLFDWELEDMAMGPSDTYTIIKVGDGTGGGLLKNPMPASLRFGLPMSWWTISKRRRRKQNPWARRL